MKITYAAIQRLCWFMLVSLLPITSMPLVKKIIGSDTVASPAIVPLVLLVFIWFLPGIKMGIKLTKHTLIFFFFFCYTVIITLISSFYGLPAFKGIGQVETAVTALATLVIGLFFFITASAFPQNLADKKRTLQIINWSGLVIILWSALQAIAWYVFNRYPQWMFDLQGVFSSRVLYRQRVTGLALEPSWLAHQLNLLYLPVWMAASYFSHSSHKFKILFFTFENILLMGGILTLGLTLSRVGFLAFFCMAVLMVGLLHKRLLERVQTWMNQKYKIGGQTKTRFNRRVMSLGLLMVYIVVIVTGIMFYSRFDPRMKGLFDFNFSQDNFLLRYFNELKFGDRVIYWVSGWNIFNQYPVLGVGLGNAGFLIPEKIAPYGWSLMEVRRLIYRESFLLNIKNLWFRLLAETGIFGFSLFIGWMVSLVAVFLKKPASDIPLEQVLGLMGLLTLAALVFEGFSIDSFAMPYWWISLGIASSVIQTREEKLNKKET